MPATGDPPYGWGLSIEDLGELRKRARFLLSRADDVSSFAPVLSLEWARCRFVRLQLIAGLKYRTFASQGSGLGTSPVVAEPRQGELRERLLSLERARCSIPPSRTLIAGLRYRTFASLGCTLRTRAL